jgi:hypothetical protein
MSFPILPTPIIRSPHFQGSENKRKSHTAPISTAAPQDFSPQDAYGQRSNSEPMGHTQSRKGSVSAKGIPNLQTSLGAALSTAMAPASPNGSLIVPTSTEIRDARRRSITELATDAAVSLLPPIPFKRNVQQSIRISREVKQHTTLPDDPTDVERKQYTIPKNTRKERKAVDDYYDSQLDGVLNKTGGFTLKDEDIPTTINPENAFTEASEPFTARRIDARKRTGSDLSEFERDIEHEFKLQQAGNLRTQQNQQEEDLKAKRES